MTSSAAAATTPRTITGPDEISAELRHVQQISRDWRAGLTEFATVGQHGTGYWTLTRGRTASGAAMQRRTASGAAMQRTDEPMALDAVHRFPDDRAAQAYAHALGYR